MKECASKIYNTNDTMRLLGKQNAADVLGEVQFSEIDNIAEARPFNFTKEAATDIFMLGYIYGKKAERTRKKKARNSNG